uniref:Ankyrin repeat domain-containing protein 13C-like n=1 Tax=Rhizophora mucronata TaxID=61149 RepID=A0A2P2P737_RHIMU
MEAVLRFAMGSSEKATE